MENILFFSSVAILVITCISAVDLLTGVIKMKKLSSIQPFECKSSPLVSVIIPACNEEKGIKQAIESQLQQDYQNIEILAVNDRSTDKTGKILEDLQKTFTNLKVIHIKSLPEDWMGKANALQVAAEKAKGKYLLFTDGDILMDSTTISRAVNRMLNEKLDHLTLIFKNISEGLLLNSLILDSGASLLQLFRPWLARNKNSRSFIGVGAFNMVRGDVYHMVGGHNSIKMHPIDDIMLGKLIKKNGYNQECLLGTDLVTVHWYNSITEMVNGLMKNILAIINYRYIMLIPLLFFMVVMNIFPFWAMIFCHGATQNLFAAIIIVRLVTFLGGTRLMKISPFCAVGTLVTPYISIYIVSRAAWLNYRDNGIFWRDTFYSLEDLKKNKPILP